MQALLDHPTHEQRLRLVEEVTDRLRQREARQAQPRRASTGDYGRDIPLRYVILNKRPRVQPSFVLLQHDSQTYL